MKPQTAALLRLLRSRPKGVTSIDVLEEIGSFRASGRILELRQAGYPIETTRERVPSGKVVARYVLSERRVDRGEQVRAFE